MLIGPRNFKSDQVFEVTIKTIQLLCVAKGGGGSLSYSGGSNFKNITDTTMVIVIKMCRRYG